MAVNPAGLAPEDKTIVQQCKGFEHIGPRLDMSVFMSAAQTPPPEVSTGREAVRRYLSDPVWKGHTVVVLMPSHEIWFKDIAPKAIHAWALQTLAPLVKAGDIQLLDYTDFFNHEGLTDCTAFFDLYHENTSGRERLTQELLKPIANALYNPLTATQSNDKIPARAPD